MTDTRRHRARRLAMTSAILFVISSAFPLFAGLSKNTAALPRWWGVLDVAVAFALVLVAIWLMTLVQTDIDAEVEGATYRAYRVLTHVILAVLVIFFLVGDRIVWVTWLTGFAWRGWLLLYTLPAWFAAVRPLSALPR